MTVQDGLYSLIPVKFNTVEPALVQSNSELSHSQSRASSVTICACICSLFLLFLASLCLLWHGRSVTQLFNMGE